MSTISKTKEIFGSFQAQVTQNVERIKQEVIKLLEELIQTAKTEQENKLVSQKDVVQNTANPKSHDCLLQAVRYLSIISVPQTKKSKNSFQLLQQKCSKAEQILKKQQKILFTAYQNLRFSIETLRKHHNAYNYYFSANKKHSFIQIINNNRCKSVNTNTYKFAIIEPPLPQNQDKISFGFRIVEHNSNWLAVGVGYRKVIEDKNYNFKINSIGHGAYMLSSNGGSWNHDNPSFNNIILGFKFGQGDTIGITVDNASKKILFKCGTKQYELPFKPIQGDQLCACIIMYFINDQVEFIDPTSITVQ